ncbi:hypothetical protein GCM10026982_03640 [Nocardiopsis aegyptia]
MPMNEPRPPRTLRAILAFARRWIQRENLPGVPGARPRSCCRAIVDLRSNGLLASDSTLGTPAPGRFSNPDRCGRHARAPAVRALRFRDRRNPPPGRTRVVTGTNRAPFLVEPLSDGERAD